MSALESFTRWCLHRAARRWPEQVRSEMEREWLAELAALESEPGTARERLAFAVSLFVSRPERGWGESVAALGPAFAVLLTGLVTLVVHQAARMPVALILETAGLSRPYASAWPTALAQAALTLIWCVAAGLWVGRRWPMTRSARFGDATPAALAPLLLWPLPLLTFLADPVPVFVTGAVLGVLIWTPATAALGVAAARTAGRGRRIALLALGVPLIGAVAGVASTLPMVFSSRDGIAGGLRGATASLLMGLPPEEYMEIVGLTSRTFYHMGGWALLLVVLTALSGAYGLGALRPRVAPAAVTRARAAGEPQSTAVVAIGAAAVAAGVLGWAYTLTILGPALSDVSESAPMPGGDGELYMWTSELRFTAVLLAALGMLIARADRRFAVASAGVTGAGLLTANGVLYRLDTTGAGGLRIALLLGAAAIFLGWAAAGRSHRGPARARVTAGAVVSATAIPMVLLQSTPGVNHPFLPAGLKVTTIGLAVTALLLAAVPALVCSRHRVPAWAAALLIGLPVTVTVAVGAIPPALSEDDSGIAWAGAFLGLPLAVVAVALLRRHRPRGRGRTTALWAALTVAAVPGTIAIAFLAVFPLTILAEQVFFLEGGGYSHDGLSIVPGVAALMLPVAALLASGIEGVPATVRPQWSKPAEAT